MFLIRHKVQGFDNGNGFTNLKCLQFCVEKKTGNKKIIRTFDKRYNSDK